MLSCAQKTGVLWRICKLQHLLVPRVEMGLEPEFCLISPSMRSDFTSIVCVTDMVIKARKTNTNYDLKIFMETKMMNSKL